MLRRLKRPDVKGEPRHQDMRPANVSTVWKGKEFEVNNGMLHQLPGMRRAAVHTACAMLTLEHSLRTEQVRKMTTATVSHNPRRFSNGCSFVKHSHFARAYGTATHPSSLEVCSLFQPASELQVLRCSEISGITKVSCLIWQQAHK